MSGTMMRWMVGMAHLALHLVNAQKPSHSCLALPARSVRDRQPQVGHRLGDTDADQLRGAAGGGPVCSAAGGTFLLGTVPREVDRRGAGVQGTVPGVPGGDESDLQAETMILLKSVRAQGIVGRTRRRSRSRIVIPEDIESSESSQKLRFPIDFRCGTELRRPIRQSEVEFSS
jgi:hypothetical protein